MQTISSARVHGLSHPTLCKPMDCRPSTFSAMEFSRQEYWSGLPFPTPGDLPDPGIEPVSLASTAWASGFFTIVPSGKPSCTSNSVKSEGFSHLVVSYSLQPHGL